MAKSGNIKGIDWPADKVERRPVDSLVPYARNARTHSESQVAQIAASIKEYGFTVPVLIDPKGNVIAGHGRIMAAKALGLAEIPVMVAKGWSAAKRRAYVILDNQVALNAGWDQDLLKLELTDLQAEGFDIGALGFDGPQLAAVMDGPASAGQSGAGSLSEKFGIPPFSVLNAREGWWQDRKRAWIALGIQSELGRGENLAEMGGAIERREAIKRKTNAIPGGQCRLTANAAPGGIADARR
ncbi:ParB/Srx family N-terminal domain-containing protein [Pseudorhodoplanes sp.]|uniref:ParB/Srx family N-terminal domain-containing protein n=1 Tax=Pseudorhodoplanes sp. TaxID=1934341 RepID=UPI002C4DE8ED|nr:ParB/Srx family N-terminal domain-containing protein [Pseudorhodoplanes sp.]HWV44102.1 ParB/Srx family N-terminal domain-containing protein [Pseudorhodoplanes sp.]